MREGLSRALQNNVPAAGPDFPEGSATARTRRFHEDIFAPDEEQKKNRPECTPVHEDLFFFCDEVLGRKDRVKLAGEPGFEPR